MTAQIDLLVKLCLEHPFDSEKIRGCICENRMDRKTVTSAALAVCDAGMSAYGEFWDTHRREPEPGELRTFGWETLFDVLIENGLDAELVVCEDGMNYSNILDSLQYLDDEDLGARIARNILLHHGTPNVILGKTSLFREVDENLITDIQLDLYPEKRLLDRAVYYWLVLVGFGGTLEGGKSPVEMRGAYSREALRNFERFSYRIVWKDQDFDLEILDKKTGAVVAVA